MLDGLVQNRLHGLLLLLGESEQLMRLRADADVGGGSAQRFARSSFRHLPVENDQMILGARKRSDADRIAPKHLGRTSVG
jgi:hypothetical protein